jgi:hypothetical protein
MRINVHIERLVLDGLPVTSLEGPRVRAAVEKELARLLADGGLSQEIRGGIAVPSVRGGAMQIGGEREPAKLGHSIARAVHEGISSPAKEKAR